MSFKRTFALLNRLTIQQLNVYNHIKPQIINRSFVTVRSFDQLISQSVPSTQSSSTSERSTQYRFYSSLQPDLKDKLDKLVKNRKIVLFMKGSKDSPKCGFSNVITQILRMHGVDYESINVLENDEIRQGIKEYSQWPTIPQLFIDGEFIGGCDIVMQMHQNGELIILFQKSGIESILKDAASSEDKK